MLLEPGTWSSTCSSSSECRGLKAGDGAGLVGSGMRRTPLGFGEQRQGLGVAPTSCLLPGGFSSAGCGLSPPGWVARSASCRESISSWWVCISGGKGDSSHWWPLWGSPGQHLLQVPPSRAAEPAGDPKRARPRSPRSPSP